MRLKFTSTSDDSSSVWESARMYRHPRSECTSTPGGGRRRVTAPRHARLTNSASALPHIAHPTTRRKNRSSTTAGCTHPAVVHTEVMSVVYGVFGVVAVYSRFSMWGGSTAATGWLCGGRPRRPAVRPKGFSTLAIVFSVYRTTRVVSVRVNRGPPYNCRQSAKGARKASANSTRWWSRALGGRSRGGVGGLCGRGW